MADHVIEIFVKGTPPALSYSDDGETRVKIGEKVRWICEAGDFDIAFASNGTPFDRSAISSSGTELKYTDRFTAKGEKKAKVEYEYTVSVRVGSKSRIVDDPVIIVDDEGGS